MYFRIVAFSGFMPSNKISGSYGGFILGFYFLFIPIYFFQWDETLDLELLFQKKHTFIKWTDLAILPPQTRGDISTRVMMNSLLFSTLIQVTHINQVKFLGI